MTLAQLAFPETDEEVLRRSTPRWSDDECIPLAESSTCSADSCSTTSAHEGRSLSCPDAANGSMEDMNGAARHYFRRPLANCKTPTSPAPVSFDGVYVRARCLLCVGGAGGATVTTASVLLEGVPQQGPAGSHHGVSLLVDQRLLRTCLEDTPLAKLMPHMTLVDQHIMPLVAREHAELTLYYDRLTEDAARLGHDGRQATRRGDLTLRSFDLTSYSEHVRLRGVPLQACKRYHFTNPIAHSEASAQCDAGSPLVDIGLGSRCVVHVFVGAADETPLRQLPCPVYAPARRITGRRQRQARGEGAATMRESKSAKRRVEVAGTRVVPKPADGDYCCRAEGTIVVFTTGMVLSRGAMSSCRRLGLCINPGLEYAARATVLVAEPPLVRSVKLLTVLPFVEAVVEARWLQDVLRTGDISLPYAPYAYHEARQIGSIEHANEFVLSDTLQRPGSARRALLQRHHFWVHPGAQPQEPPMNDLKSVLRASGGVVESRIVLGKTTVLVMPRRRCSASEWRVVQDALACCQASVTQPTTMVTLRDDWRVIFVVPDDCFRCVLQQCDLVRSTVHLDCNASMATVVQ